MRLAKLSFAAEHGDGIMTDQRDRLTVEHISNLKKTAFGWLLAGHLVSTLPSPPPRKQTRLGNSHPYVSNSEIARSTPLHFLHNILADSKILRELPKRNTSERPRHSRGITKLSYTTCSIARNESKKLLWKSDLNLKLGLNLNLLEVSTPLQ